MDEHQMALVEPGSQQQSVMAVADLSTFGVNFSDDYIFTRADIQEYRREFNAKIINNIPAGANGTLHKKRVHSNREPPVAPTARIP